jgi:hypothetical protein
VENRSLLWRTSRKPKSSHDTHRNVLVLSEIAANAGPHTLGQGWSVQMCAQSKKDPVSDDLLHFSLCPLFPPYSRGLWSFLGDLNGIMEKLEKSFPNAHITVLTRNADQPIRAALDGAARVDRPLVWVWR